MIYRNPEPAPIEQSHIKEEHEFLLLLGGAILLLSVILAGAYVFSDWVAVRIPFSAEKIIYRSVAPALPDSKPLPPNLQAAERALKQLAERVKSRMDMPQDMETTVHFIDAPTVNAAATLDGHVFVFTGLIKKLPSEDALAAVLAHEFGHIKERHPIRALGNRMSLIAALTAVGIKSSGVSRWILGEGTELTALSFSRDAEREADRQALMAVHKLYGHVAGILELFDLFASMEGQSIEMLRTHPLSENRRQQTADQAALLGYSVTGATHPLPPELAALKKP